MDTQEKTLILDLDGTLTPQATWVVFNTALGITPAQDEALFRQYRQGSLTYQEWITQLLEIYHNNTPVTKDTLIEQADAIQLHADAKAFVQNARDKHYRVILLSGSVDIMVERIAKRLGIDMWLACTQAVFADNVLVDIVPMGDERSAKVELVKNAGIELSERTISIGDGGNMTELFANTKGILIGNNETLLPLAWQQVDSLTEAAALLP